MWKSISINRWIDLHLVYQALRATNARETKSLERRPNKENHRAAAPKESSTIGIHLARGYNTTPNTT